MRDPNLLSPQYWWPKEPSRFRFFYWDSAAYRWNLSYEEFPEYNSVGQRVRTRCRNVISGVIDSVRYFTYDDSGRMIEELTTIYNMTTGGYINRNRRTWYFDKFGNDSTTVHDKWDASSSRWINAVEVQSFRNMYQGNIYKKTESQGGDNRGGVYRAFTQTVLSSGMSGEPQILASSYGSDTISISYFNAWFRWFNPILYKSLPSDYTVRYPGYQSYNRFRITYDASGRVLNQLSQAISDTILSSNVESNYYNILGNLDSTIIRSYSTGITSLVAIRETYTYGYQADSSVAYRIDHHIQYPESGYYEQHRFLHLFGDNDIPFSLPVSGTKTGSAIKTGLSAYPNPFNNTLIVNVSAPAPYTLTDLSGKALMQGNLQPESGRAAVATETLPAGMYLLHTAGSVLKVVKE